MTEQACKGSPAMTGELSEYDKNHIAQILGGEGTWFSARLIRLCSHAHPMTLEKLRLGFPETVAAYEAWVYDEHGELPSA